MPKVSVIIPAYNAEKYIKEAIDSVLNQTYPVDEIIVVDDGSTDSTGEIVRGYVKRDDGRGTTDEGLEKKDCFVGRDIEAPRNDNTHPAPRPHDVIYIYQMNKGPAAARNRGIQEAKGEYIAFLDADDVWMPEKIEKQMAVFDKNKTIAFVSTDRIRLSDTKIRHKKTIVKKRFYEDTYLYLWTEDYCIYTSSVIVKRECFGGAGMFDESEQISGAEDADMWLNIVNRYKAFYINQPLIIYRVRQDGYSRANANRMYKSREFLINKHKAILQTHYKGYKNILSCIWFKHYFECAVSFFYIDNIKEAHINFKKAFFYRPYNIKCIFYLLVVLLGEGFVKRLKYIKRRMSGRNLWNTFSQ